jgi:hypothetical protein
MTEEGTADVLLALLGDFVSPLRRKRVAELVRVQWSAVNDPPETSMVEYEWRKMLDAGRWSSSTDRVRELLTHVLYEAANWMRPTCFRPTSLTCQDVAVRVILVLLHDEYWLTPCELHDEVESAVLDQWTVWRKPPSDEWRRLVRSVRRWSSMSGVTRGWVAKALHEMTDLMRPDDFCATKDA